MSAVNLSWYLSALFIFAAIMQAAATFVPGHEGTRHLLLLVWLAASLVFAAVAVVLICRGITKSIWLDRTLQVLAWLATIVVMLIAVG